MLALKDTFKKISTDKKITQLEMANTLGISKQNFNWCLLIRILF